MGPDHDRLVARLAAGERSDEVLTGLAAACAEDAELRDALRDDQAIARALHELGRPALDAAPVLTAIARARGPTLEDQVMAGIAARSRRLRPVRRHPWRWRALAASLLAGCALSALAISDRWPVSHEPLATLHVLPQGARWPTGATGAGEGARVRPGPIALDAGAIELAFDNQAVLIVEGPARLEVLSPLRVRLDQGRVTTRIPEPAHGFTVAAAGLRVVDLGTEVGVALAADGSADVQVYAGAAQLVLDSGAARRAEAGEAVRLDPRADRITGLAFAPGRFLRAGALRALDVDLADLVGGGDGRGGATSDGIDLLTGNLHSLLSQGGIHGDRAFHAVSGQPLIAGVFVPDAAADVPITPDGATWRFPLAGGSAYDSLRRGPFLVRPPDGGIPGIRHQPEVFGGIDFSTPGHSLVGMHANAGVTIDLVELGRAHGGRAARFTALAANCAPRRLAPSLCALPGAAAADPRWAALAGVQATSAAGTVLAVRADGALLASAPARGDTYTVLGAPAGARLSAVRIDVLPDETLRGHGPGAADNGNFVLTRARFALVAPTGRRELTVIGAVADFSQAGWSIASAVDGDGSVGWGVWPEVGKAHHAEFFLDPVDVAPGERLEVRLEQRQRDYDRHLLGCFRVSTTGDRDAARDVAAGGSFLTVLVDGRLVQRTVIPLADQAPSRIDVAIPPDARWLTLATTDGGYGDGYQWAALGDARIALEPAPPAAP